MPGEWKVIPTFGGGLNLSTQPGAIDDSEWSWANGWEAIDGVAQPAGKAILVKQGEDWLTGDFLPLGMVADGLTHQDAVLIVVVDRTTKATKLYRVATDNSVTEKTVTGTAPTATYTNIIGSGPAITPCVLNGVQVIACGVSSASNYSVGVYDGTNWTRIAPSAALHGYLGCTTQSRVILASCGTGAAGNQIRISEANSTSVWDPAVSNSADDVTLDGSGQLRAICATSEGALLVGQDRVWMMRATGGIPPFSFAVLHEGGNSLRPGMACATPFGTYYLTDNALQMLGGGPVPAWVKVRRHIFGANVNTAPPKMLWDGQRAQIIIATEDARWTLDPLTNAWSRCVWENDGLADVYDQAISMGVFGGRHWFVTNIGDIYRLPYWGDTSSLYQDGLQTKDFSFGSPPVQSYVDRIKLDLEAQASLSNDKVSIYGYSRDGFAPQTVGTVTLEIPFDPHFTLLGQVTAAAPELPVRLRGKYHRFKFVAVGAPRIRGFSFRWQVTSDKGS